MIVFALIVAVLLLDVASRAEDDLSAGFGPLPAALIPRNTATALPRRGLYVALLGSHRAQQFPQLGRGDIESHVEALADRLHASASVDFIVFVPRVTHNPDGVSYPYKARIHNTTAEAKNVEAFFQEVKRAILRLARRPDVIWSFGDVSVANLASLHVPMLVTSALSNRPHALKRHAHVRYRFLTVEAWGKFAVPNPWLAQEAKVVVHSNPKEVDHLLKASAELVAAVAVNGSEGHRAAAAAAASGMQPMAHLQQQKLLQQARIPPGAAVVPTPAFATAPAPAAGTSLTSTLTSWLSGTPASPPAGSTSKMAAPTIIAGKGVATCNTTVGSPEFERGYVVGSMTAIPKRFAQVKGPFGESLGSILSHARIDRLYLNIPWAYGVRKKTDNVPVPDTILELVERSNGRLRVLRTPDYGPATKLLPTLLLPDDELPPNSVVITFDDDRVYTKNCVDALVSQAALRPDTVITVAAWPVSILSSTGKRGKSGGPNFYSRLPDGREGVQYVKAGPIDLILGFYGVAYRKRFFYPAPEKGVTAGPGPGAGAGPGAIDPLLFAYDKRPEFQKHCTYVDDIWFSGHLERLGVPRHVIGRVADSKAPVTALTNVDALSLDQGESVKQNHDNVLCAEAMRKEWGVWAQKRRKARAKARRRRR